MKTQNFLDVNGNELIVRYRKSAVFFEKKYQDRDLKEHRNGGIYIDGDGLGCKFTFDSETFNDLNIFLNNAARESWTSFEPKVIDSFGAEYDDYFDKEFGNNGSLRIGKNFISVEGPCAQPPNKENITRLIKFNKRKFESFIYDFDRKIKEDN